MRPLQDSYRPWGTLPFITLAQDAGPTKSASLHTSRYQYSWADLQMLTVRRKESEGAGGVVIQSDYH